MKNGVTIFRDTMYSIDILSKYTNIVLTIVTVVSRIYIRVINTGNELRCSNGTCNIVHATSKPKLYEGEVIS